MITSNFELPHGTSVSHLQDLSNGITIFSLEESDNPNRLFAECDDEFMRVESLSFISLSDWVKANGFTYTGMQPGRFGMTWQYSRGYHRVSIYPITNGFRCLMWLDLMAVYPHEFIVK